MSSCLLIQSLNHFEIPPDIKIYDFLDNVFVYYSESESKVEIYDINTRTLTNLDNALNLVKNNLELSSISISPSHSLIAFGFSDGKIFLYQTTSQKITKIKAKQKGVSVVCMCFISDSLLISSTNDSKLNGFRLSLSRFGITYKEFPITTLLETANILLAPPLYQYISDTTNPRCLSTLIEGIFIYKTSNNFAICKISDKFQVLIELSYQQCIFNFSPIYNDEVNVGLATTKTIEIYKITKEKKIELMYFYEVNLIPSFISFFAPTIFLVNFDEVKCYVFTIEKVTDSNKSTKDNFLDSISEIHNETIPEKGQLLNGRNSFYLFGTKGTYKISMITFYDIIDRYRKDGQFDEIVEFCKKATSGEYKATIGLPLNPVQKSIKIEESIAQILTKKCLEDLSDVEKTPYQVASYFVQLSKDLNLKNWMTTYGLKIFQSKGFLIDYFKSIIDLDTEANLFFYSKEWASSLMENIEALDAKKFLLLLPKKVIPNQLLIQAAKKKNDVSLLVDILIYKMNDYVDAAAVIWNSGNNEQLCRMYNTFLYPSTDDIQVSVSLISWLFGVKKSKNSDANDKNQNQKVYSFPHLDSLLSFNDQIAIETMVRIKQFIQKYKRPFSLTEYTNAVLHTLQNNPKLELTNKIMDLLEEIIIDSKIKIAKENLQIIFQRIFTNLPEDQPDHHDNRQALLLIIINENVSKEFNDLLLPLCDNFGFRFAKKCIYILNKEFERAFKEIICNPDENIFQFIKQTIRSHMTSKEQIGEAILSIAPSLIKNDVSEFYLILKNYYPDLIPRVILNLTDEDALRNYYIKYLIQFQDISPMNLPKDILISFCKFLCQYYPDDMKTFLESEKNSLTDFYQICKNYNVFDACAIIADYTNDIRSFILYMTHYFTIKMIAFVDSNEKDDQNQTIDQFNKSFDFVLSKLESFIAKNSSFPETEELCKSIVECFVLPFYALQIDQKQESKQEPNNLPKISKEPLDEMQAQLSNLQKKKIQLKLSPIDTKRSISDVNPVDRFVDDPSSDSDDSSIDTSLQIPNNNSKSMKISKSEVYTKSALPSSLSAKHKPIITTASASTANSNSNITSNPTQSDHFLYMQKKAEILSVDMMKICIAVSQILSYPDLLAHLTSKFENISIEYTRKSYLALINDAAYDLQTTTALAQLFLQDERNIHDKFILKHLKGIVCHAQSMTRCGTCGGALNTINNLVRIFPCGHAFHDNPKCLPKQICPICNPEVRIDQDVRRPTFAIQGNQAQRLINRFEYKINRRNLNENDDIFDPSRYYVPKKGSIKIKSVPATLPEPIHE